MLREEKFANAEERVQNGVEFDQVLTEATKDRKMHEMFKSASEDYRMLFGIVQTPEDLANCPQLEARNFYEEVDHPVIGKIKVPFRLFNMSETPSQYRIPSPTLGQHNVEVYTETLNYSKEDLVKLRELEII